MLSACNSFAVLALQRRLKGSVEEKSWARYLPYHGIEDHRKERHMVKQNGRDPALVGEKEDQSVEPHGMCPLLTWEVLSLSREEVGSRQIQRVIDDANNEERQRIVRQLEGHVVELSQCPFGNFVLQKVIETVRTSEMQFVIDEIFSTRSGPLGIAKNKYGCRILQRLFANARDDQIGEHVSLLLNSASEIGRDPFGKFVLLSCLPGPEEEKVWARSAMDAIVRSSQELCSNNHGCHVLSVAFDVASEREREAIACTLKGNSNALARMAHCRYGHAVLLKVLASLEESQRMAVWDNLGAAMPKLAQSRYGKLVLRARSSLQLP